MEVSCASMKVQLFVMIIFPQTSAVTHTLQYLYTALTPGMNFPEFTAVGLVDGQHIVYYDSSIMKMIPKTEWIQKINADDSDYWNNQTQRMQSDQEDLRHLLLTVTKDVNHTKGVHTLQRIYGCECDDDGTTRGYDQYGYDGKDFLAVDLKTGTWTAANDKAEIIKHKWESTGAEGLYCKNFLEKECIERLNTFVSYSRETLERKVRPMKFVFQRDAIRSPEVVCHATGFFPKTVMITWRKDGEEFVDDVDLRETLPNQDGSFQKRSILTVSAEDLQKHTYTCVIQHSSLEKEMVLPVSERRILKPGGGSMVLTGICCIVVALLAFALVLSLPALMERLFGVQGYLVRGGFFPITVMTLGGRTERTCMRTWISERCYPTRMEASRREAF
ncbi:major histocompatibility complex class I-related gene protein-like [Ictalurus furcatus]|uniref:major histocompatibility complex class I-related gene protein-like n=1 Tax=Ictalurus furcatus TaxID=66913 RepID=UPI00235009B6|nr:major histocompatibility complex class I-related gene protein-like [Ictalurus furcatus]